MSHLARIYEIASEENHRAILDAAVPQPGATLLDLGCADGVVTKRIAARVGAERVLGVELVRHLADQARQRGIDVLDADLGQPLPYPDASVDVVHSNQVIEHLNDTDLFLREIRRVLKPGGYALISTNNLASWHNVVSLAMGWQPPPCHPSDELIAGNPANFGDGTPGALGQMHRRLFTGRALAAVARHHGFEVELDGASGYYPLPPRASRAMARLDPRHAAYLVHRYRVPPAAA
jgi:SAM-dependent methyltransferase